MPINYDGFQPQTCSFVEVAIDAGFDVKLASQRRNAEGLKRYEGSIVGLRAVIASYHFPEGCTGAREFDIVALTRGSLFKVVPPMQHAYPPPVLQLDVQKMYYIHKEGISPTKPNPQFKGLISLDDADVFIINGDATNDLGSIANNTLI